MMAEIPHRLEGVDFVSHFRCVTSMFAHGSPELRGVVALRIIDFEVFAEPLAHVLIGTFAADIAELAHGIDGGSEVPEMGGMLLHDLETVEEMLLHFFGHIIGPETDFFLGQEAFGKELGPFILPAIPFFLFGRR